MPRENAYTYPVRMPRSLQKALKEKADQEGVSLNQYIVYALTQAASRKEDLKAK